ncbi:MAG: hypothetical protein EOO39_00195 [Cytophagaceae bacterium]|nr:MAG: hypothetical protein EOO39_00195 [Cytophagaceae bacterium]
MNKKRVAAVQAAIGGDLNSLPVKVFVHMLDPSGMSVSITQIRGRLLNRSAITEETTEDEINAALQQLLLIGAIESSFRRGTLMPVVIYQTVEKWREDPTLEAIRCQLPPDISAMGRRVYAHLHDATTPLTVPEIAAELGKTWKGQVSDWKLPIATVAIAINYLVQYRFVAQPTTRLDKQTQEQIPAYIAIKQTDDATT